MGDAENLDRWSEIADFLEQTRKDGFIADPRHMVENYRRPVKTEIDRLDVDLNNPEVVYSFVNGMVELTRLRRNSWLSGLRSDEYYRAGIQDLFTCLVVIRDYLPVEIFAKYFNPLLS